MLLSNAPAGTISTTALLSGDGLSSRVRRWFTDEMSLPALSPAAHATFARHIFTTQTATSAASVAADGDSTLADELQAAVKSVSNAAAAGGYQLADTASLCNEALWAHSRQLERSDSERDGATLAVEVMKEAAFRPASNVAQMGEVRSAIWCCMIDHV
eukprot:SAG31_NODE_653_length_13152_cov_4.899487_14_plen_158_part_00